MHFHEGWTEYGREISDLSSVDEEEEFLRGDPTAEEKSQSYKRRRK